MYTLYTLANRDTLTNTDSDTGTDRHLQGHMDPGTHTYIDRESSRPATGAGFSFLVD